MSYLGKVSRRASHRLQRGANEYRVVFVPGLQFPCFDTQFPVTAKNIPCSRGKQGIAYKLLNPLSDWSDKSCNKAGIVQNPQNTLLFSLF
jgi:hypothetical protein